MLTRQDNERLTRTGPGTPMGALFRSFWIPVLLSREIAEPDGPPVRVKVMSEDLIAFRDSTGRPALVDPVCPHRGASLFFGRNEGGGIRCAYHGWKFDAEGRCMDLPSMPADTSYRDKMRLTAYPARDWGGLVWAYMGPLGEGETPPPLPQMEFALLPPEHVFVTKKYQECNWAQACEGGLDTAHFSFLHMDTTTDADRLLKVMKGAEAGGQSDRLRWLRQDGMPRFTVHAHPAGLVLGAARTADEGRLYWRVSQFLMPCHGLAPNAFPGDNYHGQTWVPIDDTHCWIYCYAWNPERPLTAQERERFASGFSIYATVDEEYKPLARRANDYNIDREAQKRGSFTGISGVSEQDAAIQDSQGYIADRTREHLGPTDMGIVRFRRLILQAAKDLADKGIPPAARQAPGAYAVRSGGTVAPASKGLSAIMSERFGHPLGWIGKQHGLDDGMITYTADADADQ